MARLKFLSRGGNPVRTGVGSTIYERYVMQEGQTIVHTIAAFQVGAHQLNVHCNGILQEVGVDYRELDSNTIEFTRPLRLNDSVLLTIQGIYTSRLNEEYVAVANQTKFTLNSSYHMNLDMLRVYRNGILQRKTIDYTETDRQTVTLTRACRVNEVITFHEQI